MTDQPTAEIIEEVPPAPTQQWLHVEIMGHRQHWGRVREEMRFGVSMLVIEEPTEAPDVFIAHAYPGAAIFGFHACDEETARCRALGYSSVEDMRREQQAIPASEEQQPTLEEGQAPTADSLGDALGDF